MQNNKKVAYITISDPNDRHAWSGTNFYIYQALKSNYSEVFALGPAEPFLITWLCKMLHGFSLLLFKKRFDYRASTPYAKACSKLFERKLKQLQVDIIVAPAGIACIAYLKTNVPIVFIGDRVIAGALNYHRIVTNLWKWSEEQSKLTEAKAFHNSSLCIFSSPWAAEHAQRYHGLSETKIAVLPFGANMDVLPQADEVLHNFSDKLRTIQLLFIGASWVDKGAERAMNAFDYLLKMGYKAELTIVGCTPPVEMQRNGLTIIPFLNKNTQEGLQQLQALFRKASFFILPTRFDCTPIVYCEASAFAVPILSSNTGGVAGHIHEGKNGFLIPYEDTGKAYAEQIIEIVKEEGRYADLCKSTRREFDERLNWNVWINKFSKLILRD